MRGIWSALGVLFTALIIMDLIDQKPLGSEKKQDSIPWVSFINWLDMICTVSYIRNRLPERYTFSLHQLQCKPLSSLYILFNSFILLASSSISYQSFMSYQIHGALTLVLPKLSSFLIFLIFAFIPVHLSPNDAVFKMLTQSTVHGYLLRNFVWGIVKVRSLHRRIREGLLFHSFTFVQCIMLCFLSSQTSRWLSKLDVLFYTQTTKIIPAPDPSQTQPTQQSHSRSTSSRSYWSLFKANHLSLRDVRSFVISMSLGVLIYLKYHGKQATSSDIALAFSNNSDLSLTLSSTLNDNLQYLLSTWIELNDTVLSIVSEVTYSDATDDSQLVYAQLFYQTMAFILGIFMYF